VNVWLAAATPAFAPPIASNAARRHAVAPSPEEADCILFTDCHLFPHDPALRAIREHPLLRAHPEKTLVYDERDMPSLAWPGIYVSMPQRRLRPEYQEAWAYYASPEAVHGGDGEPDLLFSFVGSPSHPVRRPLVALRHDRGVTRDVRGFTFYDVSSARYDERRTEFAELLRRSKFVLCPRGRGTSSIRLYETLAAGRVPVIISDDWVPPVGPAWDSFALRVAEADVESIPALLEAREDEHAERAAAAAAAYADWFAPGVAFDRLIDKCAELLDRGAPHRFPARGVRDRQWAAAHVDHLRWCGAGKAGRLVRRVAPGVYAKLARRRGRALGG
jgi:hypothetical protein